jgi:hypothetical protein
MIILVNHDALRIYVASMRFFPSRLSISDPALGCWKDADCFLIAHPVLSDSEMFLLPSCCADTGVLLKSIKMLGTSLTLYPILPI